MRKWFVCKNFNEQLILLITIGLFLGIFIFFYFVHPLFLFDGDDWYYIYNYRKPIPIWGGWNPTRIFPEVFMPLVGYISAYFIYPFLHDYILSVALLCSVLMASLVTILYISIKQLFVEAFNASENIACALGIFIILLHFALFKTRDSDSTFLLIANDVACYFFFVIPGLINGIVSVWFLNHKKNRFFYDSQPLKKGCIVVMLYFTIFSNLYDSIILASVSFSCLFISILREQVISKKSILFIFKREYLQVIILIIWGISGIFEMNGGRAGEIGKNILRFQDTWNNFIALIKQIDHTIGAVTLFVIILSVIACFYKNHRSIYEEDKLFIRTFCILTLSLFVTVFFILIVSAKSIPEYGGSAGCMYAAFYIFFLIVAVAFSYLIREFKIFVVMFPLMIFFTLIISTNSLKPFAESNQINIPHQICFRISQDFIRQVVAADKDGNNELLLRVPKGPKDAPDNWPHPISCLGYRISHALFAHGIISKPILVKIVVDEKLNKLYYTQISKTMSIHRF